MVLVYIGVAGAVLLSIGMCILEMSRIPQPSSRGVPPKSGGIPRPTQGLRPPQASSTMAEAGTANPTTPYSIAGMSKHASKSAMKKPCPGTKPKSKEEERERYDLPALSTLKRIEKGDETEFERLKRKTARRNAPEGEDIKRIKEIMKSIKEQDISVHEFVGLVAPYTADNGTILRTVLAAELSQFRVMARRVYDTMTQDVSDVLTNEHIQLSESSKERHAIYGDKMMRAIDQIYEYYPNFDFEKYYTDPEYMQQLCPAAARLALDEVEEQNLGRQEAYHRMMWLRSEGERLQAENKKLHERLFELKVRQKAELARAAEIENEKEKKRVELENARDELEDQLGELNSSLEKALLDEEIGLADDAEGKVPPPVRGKPISAPKAEKREPENWNVRAAAEIEENITTEALIAESSRVSLASSKTSTGAIPKVLKPKSAKVKKKKSRSRQQQPQRRPPQDSSPFHYSPPRTPPEWRQQQQQEQQQRSPFHFSPTRSPPDSRQLRRSPGHYSPSRSPPIRGEARGDMETTRVTTTTRTIEEPPKCLPPPRRSMAPRDTWSGFN